MSTVTLTVKQWKRIREELQTEHPKSIFMIRDKMRQVLGFTVRQHNNWNFVQMDLESSIRLDFYNERRYTMFLLKFSEILNDNR